jgi:hypothetical protein
MRHPFNPSRRSAPQNGSGYRARGERVATRKTKAAQSRREGQQ